MRHTQKSIFIFNETSQEKASAHTLFLFHKHHIANSKDKNHMQKIDILQTNSSFIKPIFMKPA